MLTDVEMLQSIIIGITVGMTLFAVKEFFELISELIPKRKKKSADMTDQSKDTVQLLHEHNLPENYDDARPVLAEYISENNRRSDSQSETLGCILDGVNQFNSTVGSLELKMERFQKEPWK